MHYYYDIEDIKEPADLVKLAPNLEDLGISQDEALIEATESFEEYWLKEKWRRELDWKSLV